MGKCSACRSFPGRCRPCRGSGRIGGRDCNFCTNKPFSRQGDCVFCKGRGTT